MGLYSSESIADRLKGSLRVYSALLTWALENAVDTAASMKGRDSGFPAAHIIRIIVSVRGTFC